jgi:hypothetical protein
MQPDNAQVQTHDGLSQNKYYFKALLPYCTYHGGVQKAALHRLRASRLSSAASPAQHPQSTYPIGFCTIWQPSRVCT